MRGGYACSEGFYGKSIPCIKRRCSSADRYKFIRYATLYLLLNSFEFHFFILYVTSARETTSPTTYYFYFMKLSFTSHKSPPIYLPPGYYLYSSGGNQYFGCLASKNDTVRRCIVHPSVSNLLNKSDGGAKKVVPVSGVEKSSILSCRPGGWPMNMRCNIFSITHNRLEYPMK